MSVESVVGSVSYVELCGKLIVCVYKLQFRSVGFRKVAAERSYNGTQISSILHFVSCSPSPRTHTHARVGFARDTAVKIHTNTFTKTPHADDQRKYPPILNILHSAIVQRIAIAYAHVSIVYLWRVDSADGIRAAGWEKQFYSVSQSRG